MGVDLIASGGLFDDEALLLDYATDEQLPRVVADASEANSTWHLDSIDATPDDALASSSSLMVDDGSLSFFPSQIDPLGDVTDASVWWDTQVNKKNDVVSDGSSAAVLGLEFSINLDALNGSSSGASTSGNSPIVYPDGEASPGEPSAKEELGWDEDNLTPLELRRKRNRESMQRARRRQRDELEKMRGTLQVLENHYQKLSEEALERRKSNNANTQNLGAEYYNLADLSHALQEEKFLLEQQLIEKQKTHRRMKQVMIDREEELELPPPLSTPDWTLFSDFDFLPITEDQASERIRQCYERIRSSEVTARPLPGSGDGFHARAGEQDSESLTTFGWSVTCQITVAHEFFACFSKFFVGVSPQVAMEKSWARYTNRAAKFVPSRHIVRYEVLQVLNDSTYVAGMDAKHPVKEGKLMRGMHMGFKLQTDNGCALGRSCVNPSTPEIRALDEKNSSFEYVDSTMLIEFLNETDTATGAEGCLIKWYCRTDYNTQEDTYLRLVNALSGTLKWESAVMPLRMKLLTS